VGWAGEKPSRYFYFIDVDSVTRDGDVVTFWEQESFEADEPNGSNRLFNFRRGNCRTLATQILRSRAQKGNQVIGRDEKTREWVEHPEGSMMGDGMKMVCGRIDYDSGPLVDPDGHARQYFSAN
jgi:hypothetical protein